MGRKESPFRQYGGIRAWGVTGIDQGSTSDETQETFARSILNKRGYRIKAIVSGAMLPFLGIAAFATDASLLGNAGAHYLTNTPPDTLTAVDAAITCGVNIATPIVATYALHSGYRWGKSIFETRSNARGAAEEDTDAENTLVMKYLRARHWALIDNSLTVGFLALGAAANAVPVLGQFAGPIIAFGGGAGTGIVIDILQAGAKKHMYDDARQYIGKKD